MIIHPRAWNIAKTCFEADDQRLGGKDPRFVLGSPNFRERQMPGMVQDSPATAEQVAFEPQVEIVAASEGMGEQQVPPDVEGYRLVLLRFFRDLTEGDRLRILVELDAVPADITGKMTHAIERQLLDWLVKQGKMDEVTRMIEAQIAERRDREA